MGWYISKKGVTEGAYTDEQMKEFVNTGHVKPNDLVWMLGFATWTPANKVPRLLGHEQESLQHDEANHSEPYPVPGFARVTQPGGKSYLARHWHGELSLLVSYWVNGLIVALIFAAVLFVVPWDDLLGDAPKIFLIAVFALWVFEVLATVWQAVGIWRSANNYLRQGKPKRWGTLAKAAVVLGLIGTIVKIATVGIPQLTEYTKIATGNDPLGTYQLRVIRDATELEISGAIVLGLTKNVISSLDSHPKIRIVHLNSQGGRVGEARKLRDVIASRQLATFTASGCFSACTLAYAAGHRRLIAKGASLGFHQYSFPGTNPIAFQHQYEMDKRDWLARGFDRAFVDRAFTTPNNDLWRPSHRELLAARVITGYPEHNEVAISGFQIFQWENFEAELGKNPLFAALKEHEPTTYHQLISELRIAIKAGRSQAEIRDKVMPVAQSVYRQRLPYASDSALLSFIDLLLEQMNALYSTEPTLCYQYVYPDRQGPILDTTKYFSKEMTQKELAIMAEVIRTAATQTNHPPQKAQIEHQIKDVLVELGQRHGDSVKWLANPSEGKADMAKMCALTYDFYQTIRRLPQPASGSLLRFMFADGK